MNLSYFRLSIEFSTPEIDPEDWSWGMLSTLVGDDTVFDYRTLKILEIMPPPPIPAPPWLAQSVSGLQETGWCVACGCDVEILCSVRALRNRRVYREGACAICGGPVSMMTGYE